MRRRKRTEVEVRLELRSFVSLRCDMELRNGKVLFTVSNAAMAAPASTEETQKLISTPSTAASLYARAQAITRGYLWFTIAATVVLLALGLVFFPQKMWNRIMMALFGCVTLHVRGKQYKFCEEAPAQEQGPAFL